MKIIATVITLVILSLVFILIKKMIDKVETILTTKSISSMVKKAKKFSISEIEKEKETKETKVEEKKILTKDEIISIFKKKDIKNVSKAAEDIQKYNTDFLLKPMYKEMFISLFKKVNPYHLDTVEEMYRNNDKNLLNQILHLLTWVRE